MSKDRFWYVVDEVEGAEPFPLPLNVETSDDASDWLYENHTIRRDLDRFGAVTIWNRNETRSLHMFKAGESSDVL